MTDSKVNHIIKILNNDFKNKNINVIFSGSIDTIIHIPKMRFFISKDTTVLYGEKNSQLKIDNYWIDSVKVQEKSIMFVMDSDFTITIDC